MDGHLPRPVGLSGLTRGQRACCTFLSPLSTKRPEGVQVGRASNRTMETALTLGTPAESSIERGTERKELGEKEDIKTINP